MKYNLNWLKNKFDNEEKIKYIFFWGHSNKEGEAVGKFVFSQWWHSQFTVDGLEYTTAEHWMMAQKAILFGDNEIVEEILSARTPAEAKKLGRKVKGFNEQQWNECKYELVKTGNLYKFQQDKVLADYLITTGDRVLVEASPVDNIWGIGLAQDAENIENPHTWKGENLLGFALMEVRDMLKEN